MSGNFMQTGKFFEKKEPMIKTVKIDGKEYKVLPSCVYENILIIDYNGTNRVYDRRNKRLLSDNTEKKRKYSKKIHHDD